MSAKNTPAGGRLRAAQHGGGLIHPEVDRLFSEYHRLPTDDARAGFADKWVRLIQARMGPTLGIQDRLLAIIRTKELYRNPSYMEDGRSYETWEEYLAQVAPEIEEPLRCGACGTPGDLVRVDESNFCCAACWVEHGLDRLFSLSFADARQLLNEESLS